ncbi:chondroitin sulfate synthase 1-like [Aplysia californica]|uniref:Chondroitin sulfate synthase 1-like n=1 Tax=Aplysia californica TaxID=6500 RepID=A0ABM0ZUV6_APLCA|nr:chondroitin sulfate synthase 1-like [Aplysia californica]
MLAKSSDCDECMTRNGRKPLAYHGVKPVSSQSCRKNRKGGTAIPNSSTFFLGLVVGLFLGTSLRLLPEIPDGDCLQKTLSPASIVPEEDGFRKQSTSSKENSEGEEVDFLFVGVMTTLTNLHSRAMASNNTWVQRVPGKVVYFVGDGANYTGDLHVVQLAGVLDNDYPPRRKSFAMLKYITQHYAQKYEVSKSFIY